MMRLLEHRRGHTADVERPHGQLRAGLADRLGGDDADRLADLDRPAGGQVAAVALGAAAALAFAGQHGADLELFARRCRSMALACFSSITSSTSTMSLAGDRILDVLAGDAAEDAGRRASTTSSSPS